MRPTELSLVCVCLLAAASGCVSPPRMQRPVVPLPAAAPLPPPPMASAAPPPPVAVPRAALAVPSLELARPQPAPVVETGPLDQFMADRPEAGHLLRQHPALAQWFRTEWNRPAAFPIIWDNQPPKTSPVAENSSSSQTHFTSIRVSPKLSPVDQLMGLCYETCNAEGRPRINSLALQAATGKITRTEFAEGIAEAEYGANLRLRQTFPVLLPLSRDEIAHDILYQNVLQIPPTYAAYQAWNLRTHNENFQHAQELYGREYDELVKRGPTAVPSADPGAGSTGGGH